MEFDQITSKFNELIFLFPAESTILKAILFYHSINLLKGLECTGILEDDPQGENFILPPNWENPIENIYSLRYQTKEKTNIYYKFINIENKTLEINAVNSLDSGVIHSIDQDLANFVQTKEIAKKYCEKVLDRILLKKENPKENKKEPNIIDRDTLFWGQPNRDTNQNTNINTNNPFGNYGRSDLQPIPLGNNENNIFGNRNTGGNYFGPNNPIFNNPQGLGNNPNNPFNPNNPGVRFDPFGPEPDINNFFPNPNSNNPFPKPGTGFGPFGFNKPF